MTGGPRLVAARVLATVGALFWGFLFYGLQDALTVFIEGAAFAADYVLESGWGLIFLVCIGVPLAGLAFRPGTGLWVGCVLAAGLALAVGAVLSWSAPHLLPAAGVLVTGAVVGLAGDARPVRGRLDRPVAVLALIGAGPAAAYAVDMASRFGHEERTWWLGHYPVQAALGVTAVLVTTMVAMTLGSGGRVLATATVVVTACWIGLESVVYPHRFGSVGTVWGWALVVWGVALAAAVLVSQTRERWDRGLQASETRSA